MRDYIISYHMPPILKHGIGWKCLIGRGPVQWDFVEPQQGPKAKFHNHSKVRGKNCRQLLYFGVIYIC